MSKLNEKLAASVKATGNRAAPAKGKAGEPPTKAKPAATAPKTAADKAAIRTNGTPEPGASGSVLFPSRIWPD